MVDTILEAANRVFGNHDYDRATTIRVAERAGVSVGSLYQYFPNKEGIINALAARIVNHHLNRLEQKITALGELPAHAAIEELVQLISGLYFSNRRSMKILFERTTARRDLAPIVLQARHRAIGMIEALFLRYPRGILKPGDPRLAATLLVHGILGILEVAIVDPLGVSDEVLTNELSALARRYLFSD
jgi:AcrR family transcriptional regulator